MYLCRELSRACMGCLLTASVFGMTATEPIPYPARESYMVVVSHATYMQPEWKQVVDVDQQNRHCLYFIAENVPPNIYEYSLSIRERKNN